mgnify:CR=1 FL=1
MESQDIFIEVGHGPTLIDNNILLSRYGLRLATEGVAAALYLNLGSTTVVGAGTDWEVDGRVSVVTHHITSDIGQKLLG